MDEGTGIILIRDMYNHLNKKENRNNIEQELFERCENILIGPYYWELLSLARMDGSQITDELTDPEADKYNEAL